MDLLGKTSMGCAARRQEQQCREQAANTCKDLAWLISAGTGGNLQCPLCSLKQCQNLVRCLNPHLPCKIHLAIIKCFLSQKAALVGISRGGRYSQLIHETQPSCHQLLAYSPLTVTNSTGLFSPRHPERGTEGSVCPATKAT